MADIIVNVLLQQLPQLIESASFPSEVENEVKSFQRQLERINIFLEDSDEKWNEHKHVKALVRQITEVVHVAEDVIDTFIFEVEEQRKRGIVGQIIHRIPHAKMLRNVAKKIECIDKEINKIYNDIEKYGIERAEASVDTTVEKALHRHSRHIKEDDVVGFGHASDILVNQLTNGTENLKLDVISIIGMGGLGKTTLANKIYNDDRVKNHFDICVWVYVSQDFKTKELLVEILKSLMPIPDDEGTTTKEYLAEKLLECLQGKRYLVVMDDVWETQVWNEVKDVFPDNSNGSRILITSRRKEVALDASVTPPYELPLLNEDKSWELFCKKVFRGGECPRELETLGREIVQGCRGLPLSIVVLGGVLAKKEKTHRTWLKVVADVNWYLTECKDILALSYTQLPRRLKPCFLYFGAYPEDFEIPTNQLIQLWIAEGFIQHIGRRNIEDVADDYLEELIDRNLIQVTTRRSDEGAKKCRIHDLLLDLCITKCAEENFLCVPRDDNSSSWKTYRRLSIHNSTLDQFIFSNTVGTSCARTFLYLGRGITLPSFEKIYWEWVFSNLKMLRILHLEIEDDIIPEGLKTLNHLRYLKIVSSRMYMMRPKHFSAAFIGNLTNLETLKIYCGEFVLPNSIMELPHLRNLCGQVIFPYNPLVTALCNLQVLSVILDSKIVRLIVEGKLPNIRKLGLTLVLSEESDGFVLVEALASVRHLNHLQTLKIENGFGPIISLPNSFPKTITKISLTQVKLDDDGMEVLGKLPKLGILKLQNCLSASGLQIHAHSFPQLQFLKLHEEKIEEWKQDEGAMPGLRHLVIFGCSNLIMLSAELRSLTALQEVEVFGNNLNLTNMFRELHMELGFKLKIYGQQKIVMNVHMHCDKCRTMALKVAAVTSGVTCVAIEGAQNDRLAVTGNGIDAVGLVTRLRKKVGNTHIVSVGPVGAS